MTLIDDDFDPINDGYVSAELEDFPRGQYGRALIIPPVGRATAGRASVGGLVAYGRISTIAQYADPAYGLGVWQQRHGALAIARRPDLIALLCGLTYQQGKQVQAVIDEALMRAKDDDTDVECKLLASNLGTAFHQFSTPGCPEPDPAHGPDLAQHRVALDALRVELDRLGLEIVSSERHVVHDGLGLAGTYDHIVVDRAIGTMHVLDKKTGRESWPTHIAQLEGYAEAEHYSLVTGERTPHAASADVGYIAGVQLATGRVRIARVLLDGQAIRRASATHAATLRESIAAKVEILP
jgi:hypothetical protein